jgi:hypothetical protein
MKQKQTIETQLDCKATAALQQEICSDLDHEDKPLASLLSDETKEDSDDEVESSG